MPAGGRGRAGPLLAALAVLIAGCATVPPPPTPTVAPLRLEEVRDLLARWAGERQAFTGFRAAADVTVRRQGRTDRIAAVLLVARDRLRLEGMTPLGFPALVAVAGPERVTVLYTLERTAWWARPTPDTIRRWLGVALAPEVLIGFLAGLIPLPADPALVEVTRGAEGAHLVYSGDGVRYRVWATPGGQPARLVLEDGRRTVVTFARGADGGIQGVHVEVPGEGTELSVRYLSVEAVTPPGAAFDLTLPPDIEQTRVD